MAWTIEFLTSAEKEFSKLPKNVQKNIRDYLVLKVQNAPRTYGKAMKGNNVIKLWRYRVQDYRLICQIKDTEIIVLVVKIGKRDSIYK